MFVLDDLAIGFSLLIALDYSFNFVGDKIRARSSQKAWEKKFLLKHCEFIEKHPDNTSNDYIKLLIQNRAKDNLLGLCRQYYSKKGANYYVNNWFEHFDPKIETINYIGFRRMESRPKPKPVRAEIIRCNKNYGLIASEEMNTSVNGSAYALTRSKSEHGLNGDVFYIDKLFSIKEDIRHSEEDQRHFENEVLTRHREFLELNRGNLQNSVILSNLNEEEIKRFEDLCKRFKSIWSFGHTELMFQPTYLQFRRVDSPPEPFRVEMIQCAGKYAIMEAEKHRAVYLLTKGEQIPNLDDTGFNIYAKIFYTNKIPPADLPVNDGPASNSPESSRSDSQEPQQTHK